MPLTDHADPDAFHRLLYGNSSRDETRRIVRHLLAGCGRCLKRSVTARAVECDAASFRYDELFGRVERWLDLELAREPVLVAPPLAALR